MLDQTLGCAADQPVVKHRMAHIAYNKPVKVLALDTFGNGGDRMAYHDMDFQLSPFRLGLRHRPAGDGVEDVVCFLLFLDDFVRLGVGTSGGEGNLGCGGKWKVISGSVSAPLWAGWRAFGFRTLLRRSPGRPFPWAPWSSMFSARLS